MATQEIPCGNQGLRSGTSGIGPALQWLFAPKSPAKPVDLRRNGPVRAKVPYFLPDCAGSAGMNPASPRHVPVLGRQAIELLNPRDGGIYVDATFRGGGYSRAILDVSGTRVVGIDRDRSAILGGFDLVDRSGGRLTLVEDRFSNLDDVCAAQGAD